MKVKISEIEELSQSLLCKWGFQKEEAVLITENCIEGELTNKKSHGLIRLLYLKKQIETGRISTREENISVIKETPVSLLIDGKGKTGLYVVNKALEMGLEKVQCSGLLIVGVSNTAPMSGLIGQYARKATDQDLIFIGFNNSPARTSGIVPFGSLKRMLGTNPLTVGLPTKGLPIILDMASSKITVGDVLIADKEKKAVPKGSIINLKGVPTTEPGDAMEESLLGGILPIAGYKGSGLAMIVELLAGALTDSRCGHNVDGGWGSLFILINPNILRPLEDYKNDIMTFTEELKSSPRMDANQEIYFPGERSQKIRAEYIRSGCVEISDSLLKELTELDV